MKIETMAERPDTLIYALLDIWEASVRATHYFLTENDIQSIRPHVKAALAEIPSLTCAISTNGIPHGFLGVGDDKIEMLFISPLSRGQGLGRQFIDYAVGALKAVYVDVNEQNVQGAGFYKHLGFRVFKRSHLDEQGNPFPILHMRMESKISIPNDYSIQFN